MIASLSPAQVDALEATMARLTSPAQDLSIPITPSTAESIVQCIAARPWRRSAVDRATVADMDTKVNRAVATGEPIEFSLPFGGYRGWHLPSAPDLDWAEVFWIDYLRSFGQRIAALHPPGVRISLSYVGGVMGWMNQLPEEAQSRYIDGLERLLEMRSTPRLDFQLVDHAEAEGGRAAVLALLQAREAAQPPPSQDELDRARRNLVWADACREGEPPPEALVIQSAKRCAVLMQLESRRAFNKYGPRHQLSHGRGTSLSLHIGSCRSAIAQPWVSVGFLQWCPQQGEWIERLATGQAAWEPRSLVSVEHPLSGISPVLRSIPLVP